MSNSSWNFTEKNSRRSEGEFLPHKIQLKHSHGMKRILLEAKTIERDEEKTSIPKPRPNNKFFNFKDGQ